MMVKITVSFGHSHYVWKNLVKFPFIKFVLRIVLQPVKGYNIVEKIKLANEQLYELEIPYKRNKRSKVSFRENLVDFEPDCSSDDGWD